MATHDYVIANGTGAAVRSDLNDALAAIVSNNSSTSEPATTYAYQWWADTTNNVLKIRNSANNAWITLRELDGTMLIEDGSASSPGLSFASDLDTGLFRTQANQISFATGGVERLKINNGEAVFNEVSNDVDFRVESNGNTHMLFVDAGNDRVGLGIGTPTSVLDIRDTQTGAASEIKLFNLDQGNTTTQTSALVMTPDVRANGAKISVVKENADFSSAANKDIAITFASVSNNTATERARIDANGNFQVNSGQFTVGTTATTGLQLINDGTFGTLQSADLKFRTNSAERARIDTSGRLLLGTSNSRGNFFNGSSGYDTLLQIERAGYATASIVRNSNNTAAPQFILGKTRGTSNGTATIVNSGDVIGDITFQAADGAKLVQAAGIEAEVDGTPGTSDMPGRLVFSTTSDGAASPTERVRINSSGNVGVGVTDPQAKLEVKGVGDITGTPFEYTYSTDGGIKVTGNESTVDIVSTDSGNHAGSLIIRGVNKGYALLNDSGNDLFRLTSFTASANNWNIHETSGSSVSSFVRLASFRKSGGMCFGNDTAAANALDDYEEGQWTPTLQFGGSSTGISYGANTGGSYVKIGRMVFIHCRMELTNKGSLSGNATIEGLPFTQGNIQSGGSGIEAVTHLGGYQQNVFSTTLTNVSVGGTIGENSTSIALRFLNYATGDHVEINSGHFENASSFGMDFIIQT